jgi:DNA helicase-2/ATP-dependent DNA helicase PcrA
MEQLINKKTEYKNLISEYQSKILELENKIIHIEKEMAQFSDIEILDTLKLSKQQKEIVESKEQNILVVACPGSGKTHTLISRYINLVIKEKINSEEIILITFTKKAGMEMNERINNIIPNHLPYYVGSLHGLGYRLLQQHTKTSYTVIDEKDSNQILKDCTNLFITNEEDKIILNQITYIYDKVSTTYPINIDNTLKILNINVKYKKIINKILKEYNKQKKQQNLYDFNDLMIKFCELLDTGKLDNFINKIKYIFFDEYQDVNMIQNYILNKFNNKANIMVVGDDAQAIYAFRGSSVEYIWDFEKNFNNTKKYYLETNYRSTPAIVNFCQDIITHNTKQFKKNVISSQKEYGLKPQIYCHNNQIEQYKWVVNDIVEKQKKGISLKNMVVLARTNKPLKDIEVYFLNSKIQVIKSIGTSLLNKSYIKDFFAFLTIIINTKSIFHWKRILALHKNIGIEKSNYIVEQSEDIFKTIETLIKTNEIYKQNLENFYLVLKDINNTDNINKKISYIQLYLENLYKLRKDKNIESIMNDIQSILIFFKNTSIEDFVNNIYLNYEMEIKTDDILFLTTGHCAKGLEWEHVYIIDMTSKDFPSIRQNFYKYEANNCEEERRLFYVAASRAKKYLYINYYTENYNIYMSPFIRELNNNNYLSSNINQEICGKTGIISTDVNNYLRFNGYTKLSQLINTIPHNRTNIINSKDYLPIHCDLKYMYIVGNFMDYLIIKMINNHFPNLCYKFDLPLNNIYQNFPQNLYHTYKDCLIDWRDCLEDIYKIATFKIKKEEIIEEYNDILINEEMIKYYKILEKSLLNFIKNKKPKKIMTHINLNYKLFRAEADIIMDDMIIEMKCSTGDACTFPNVSQVLMYGYLLNKKNLNTDIKEICIFNSYDGCFDIFDSTNINYNLVKETIYI